MSVPSTPKIAPEAPSAAAFGSSSSTPIEPHSSDTLYAATKRALPIAGSSERPMNHRKIMLNRMCRKFACRKPLVATRQYSWSTPTYGPYRKPCS
jgi:hypothetical protein